MNVEVGVSLSDELVAIEGKDPVGFTFLQRYLEEVVGEGRLKVDGISGLVEREWKTFLLEGGKDAGGLVLAAVIGDDVMIDEGRGMADEGFDDIFLIAGKADGDEARRARGKKALEDIQGTIIACWAKEREG
ncbi:MAG: hypothetical protein AAGD22_17480 [Verrucomicrobiota bacterium]